MDNKKEVYRMKKNKIFLGTIIVISICIIIFSYHNNRNKDKDYDDYMYEYYDKYFEIAKVINNINDNETEILRKEENQQIIIELEDILKKMEADVPENRLHNYTKLNEWLQELVELSDEKNDDWWGLTIEERLEIDSKILWVKERLDDWEDKESGIAWYM